MLIPTEQNVQKHNLVPLHFPSPQSIIVTKIQSDSTSIDTSKFTSKTLSVYFQPPPTKPLEDVFLTNQFHPTSHKMNLTSESTEQALPPLLALPVEVKLKIISCLPHDEYPSQACLRRTHSSFLPLIPKSDIRSKLTETELCNQLLRTELEYAYLLPPAHYPCYFCARVQPLDAFVVAVDPLAVLLFDGHRCCLDCRLLKHKSYGRSFLETLIWIGSTLEKLPMPPSPPQLRSSARTPVQPPPDGIPNDVKQRMRSEVYEEVSVLVSQEGWDVWWVLKCIFSINHAACR